MIENEQIRDMSLEEIEQWLLDNEELVENCLILLPKQAEYEEYSQNFVCNY
jgi:hypothetical protein